MKGHWQPNKPFKTIFRKEVLILAPPRKAELISYNLTNLELLMIKMNSNNSDLSDDKLPTDSAIAERPKLVLLISSLAMGGAERVVSLLAQGWEAQEIELVIVTLADTQKDFYVLPDSVQRVQLGLHGPSTSLPQAVVTNLRRVFSLRKTLRSLRPTCVISHLDAMNIIALLATRGLDIPVLVTEHTDIDEYQEYLPAPWRILRRATYKKAAAVVAVSQNTIDQLKRFVPERLLHNIPNPTDPNGCLGETSVYIQGPTIVTMGRLVESKGFDVLIKAFARAREESSLWKLLILGDGPERAQLEALARELGLGDQCVFAGPLNKPGPVLAQADIFALASRLEGFPMSLVEAMVCGLPVVCTRYSSDADKIVSHGIDGYLVDVGDEDGIVQALGRLMVDDELRARMSLKAKELTERFSLNSVLNQWNQLLTETTGRAWPQL